MQPAFRLPELDAAAEARNAQALSAWMDEDASADRGECGQAYLISDAGRATWDTYHLIGDVLRTPDLAVTPTPAFAAKLADALAAEPAHDVARVSLPAVALAAQPYTRFAWPGLALAAALALVVWMARPFLPGADADRNAVLASETHQNTHQNAGQNARNSARNSAAVAGLHNYLDAHRQLVGPSVVRQVSFGGAGARASVVRTGAGR